MHFRLKLGVGSCAELFMPFARYRSTLYMHHSFFVSARLCDRAAFTSLHADLTVLFELTGWRPLQQATGNDPQ